MALNLDGVAKFVETLMIDECMIVRRGRQEDSISANWNESTGTYSKRVNEEAVYEGKCMVYTRRTDAQSTKEAGQDIFMQQKYVSLPRDAEIELKPEDELTITDIHAGGDETLIGKTFIVEAMDQGTYYATREVALMDRNSRSRT